ncbi:MAG TPA: hypothetical protein PLU80_04130, partial [Acidobacteriota bacterium]|nr:hypothetical protein [Acidobacteriota bacterium]
MDLFFIIQHLPLSKFLCKEFFYVNQRFSLRLFLNLVCLICVATLCACNQAASSSSGGAEVAAKV